MKQQVDQFSFNKITPSLNIIPPSFVDSGSMHYKRMISSPSQGQAMLVWKESSTFQLVKENKENGGGSKGT
jgi:hypothetical protein